MARDSLTVKQRRFVEAYLGEAFYNATKAARLAGYAGSDNVLGQVGFENIRKPEIKAELDARLAEAAMPAHEVLARLTRFATGDVDDLLDEDGKFDLKKARKGKKTGLLKKLRRKTTSKKVDAVDDEGSETLETSLIFEDVEFEMYSAHEALRDLAKYHKLLTDRTETKVTFDLSSLSDEEVQALAAIAPKLTPGS